MQAPVDYPIKKSRPSQESGHTVTYAELLDHHANDGKVTDQMIRLAERNLAAADQIPTASKPMVVHHESVSNDLIDRIRQVIS